MPDDGIESTEQPGANAPDLDALVAKMQAEFDKRFQGFQSVLDRRDAEYRQMLEDAATANLSPEEQESVQASKLAQENEAFKRKIAILEKRKDYPEEVDLLNSLLEGKSLEDQLALLSNFRKAEPAPRPDEGNDEGNSTPTPVDANNPKRKEELSLKDLSEGMSAELSEKIMQLHGNESGILRRLRQVGSS